MIWFLGGSLSVILVATELLVPVFARAIRGMADLHWTAAVAELGAMLEVSSLLERRIK
jgi:hypothetical protein